MKNDQSKFLRTNLFISKYLLFALPVIIGTIIWGVMIYGHDGNVEVKVDSFFWEIVGWHFIIWFVALVYFLVLIIVSTDFRNIVLSKITRSEECDERESYISGRASKATFFLTLAVMIVMLFLSGINVHIFKPSDKERLTGKKGTISIGYRPQVFEQKNIEKEKKQGYLLDLKGIPLTKEGILLILILVHIGGYHIFVRRRVKKDEV